MVADLLLGCAATFFAGMGVVALVRPARVVARFGTAVVTPDGRNEVRAVYGGFGVACAALLVWAVLVDGAGAFWVGCVLAVLTTGMAAGRIVSLVVDRTRGTRVIWTFLLVEILLVLLLGGSSALRHLGAE